MGGADPQGWESQLEDEPGLVLSYECKWRLRIASNGRTGIDFIPELDLRRGRRMLRFGHNLQADYGPARIRPA